MNIHEHQAKEILKEFGAPVSNGVVINSIDEIQEKILVENLPFLKNNVCYKTQIIIFQF